jgi:hypothetical protein
MVLVSLWWHVNVADAIQCQYISRLIKGSVRSCSENLQLAITKERSKKST